jgi:putative redox protein
MVKPPILATLTWQGDLRFSAASENRTLALDGHSASAPSPVEALAMALAGCMAVDVADIVVKGRHLLRAMETTIVGQRAEDVPRRFTGFALHFTITGSVPTAAVERAIQLSHDKYCSVWHSLRQDITFKTTFEVRP